MYDPVTTELSLGSAPDETVALLTAESINRLFGMSLFEVSADDENDFEARMLRSTVISDFLESRQAEESSQIASLLGIDVFDESVNLAALFGAATNQDTQMFASLSSDFERRSQEIENQLSAARIAMGSSFTVTTGLSVGYFLYLLRGGAIMSSMLTSLPAWRFVDPLPILGNLQDSLDADNESRQSLVSKKRSVAREKLQPERFYHAVDKLFQLQRLYSTGYLKTTVYSVLTGTNVPDASSFQTTIYSAFFRDKRARRVFTSNNGLLSSL